LVYIFPEKERENSGKTNGALKLGERKDRGCVLILLNPILKKLMKLLFTLILITAALSSLNCNMYGPSPGLPDAVKVDEIPDFMKAEEIQIEDDWTGLSPVAPIKRHYALQRSENNFTGTANLSVGGARRQARSASENIVIPMNMALSFLEKLEQADFREGDYEPNLKWTDDYPSIKIELRIKGENVVIFSKS
jgi:hypothetical protein